MSTVSIQDGGVFLLPLIQVIQENKQYLSDIDGLIGDGDHGINMNKGFTLCAEKLQAEPGDLSHGFKTLSQVLMTQIGGSMGPLYGMFFKAMAKRCKGQDTLDAAGFGDMLTAARDKVLGISGAQLGDKTLLDVLLTPGLFWTFGRAAAEKVRADEAQRKLAELDAVLSRIKSASDEFEQQAESQRRRGPSC